MSLDYALVTSSSLPNQVQGSEYYTQVDKAQWLDLVDYCEDLVEQDGSQNITFLIVAKGTEEQEQADRAKKEAAKAEKEAHAALESKSAAELAEKEQENRLKAAKEAANAQTRKELRRKSKSIFNALYSR